MLFLDNPLFSFSNKKKFFLSNKFRALFSLSILLSITQFLSDIALAFSLSSLLEAMTATVELGHDHMTYLLTELFLVATIRGIVWTAQNYVQGLAQVEFECSQRQGVTDLILNDNLPNTSKINFLYMEKIQHASSFILHLLMASSRIVLCFLISLYLFSLSPQLSFITSTVLLLLYIPYKKVDKQSKNLAKTLDFLREQAARIFSNSTKNLLLLRIYNTKHIEVSKINYVTSEYQKTFNKFYLLNSSRSSLPFVFGIYIICILVLLIDYGQYLERKQTLLFLYALMRIIQILGELSAIWVKIDLTQSQAIELGTYISLYSLTPQKFSTASERIKQPIGWNISNVLYSYNRSNPLFKDFNCIIWPGSCCVITGTSGRGKSTLLNLMLGLETPQSGTVSVRCDNSLFPIQQIKEKLLNSIGYVGPENFLVSGTIQDNLLYGTGVTDVSSQEIENNLKLAHCHFVFDLPDGVHHRITEQGEGLSAGQKQRLMLARALLRQPKALFLDEATANLDAESEGLLLSTLQELKKSVTIIAVTHKPAFLKIADQHIDLNTLSSK